MSSLTSILRERGSGAPSGLTRRRFLGRAAAAAGSVILASAAGTVRARASARPGTMLDELVPEINPVLRLRNTNTGERFHGTYFDWRTGNYHREVMGQLNWFFRDWRERAVMAIDPRLFWALSALSQGAIGDGHDGEIRVTSGYRTPQTNRSLPGAARNSYHLRGKAVDLQVRGIPPRDIAEYMAWLGVGGVGRYSTFVHIDSGDERRW